MELVPIRVAARELGVRRETLRAWEREGKIDPPERTPSGQRRYEIVNAAYTSQECPACGHVDKGNRKGDLFRCLKCGFTAHADRVGAINTMHRHTDPELRERIHPSTPKEMVKAILLQIYQRRQTTPSPHPI